MTRQSTLCSKYADGPFVTEFLIKLSAMPRPSFTAMNPSGSLSLSARVGAQEANVILKA